ncbi:hypothetical protein [Candidatus Clostridium stratigraminis]|uniref:Uncharacterized protein n=1 Tax=Candidatus Clostridium stratigraminis TaxID=3381661 RepID=A0ABW8T7R5_9CLOT
MKKVVLPSIILLVIILIFGLYNLTAKTSSNSLKISKDDEKIILEYLDTKTNDILAPLGGKLYSAFTVLGTDDNKIYILMLKEEFIKHGNEMIQNGGVSAPMVLNVQTNDGKIKIIGHKYPRDGEEGSIDLKRLFPKNVRNVLNKIRNDGSFNLQDAIKNRIKGENLSIS